MKLANPVDVLKNAKPVAKPSDPLVPTIFHEPWWLDVTTGGRYEEVTVSSGGKIVGRFPYERLSRLGFQSIIAPELTLYLGPAVDEGNGGTVSRNLRRGEITRELIEKLPPFGHMFQQLHGGIPDALPFVQHDFRVCATFTYEVGAAPEATIWRNMRDKTRNVIRRAQEQTELTDLDPDEFCALYEANLERRSRHFNYMMKAHSPRIIEAAVSRGRGRVLAARNDAGDVLAAIFYVWDENTTFYLLTTRAPDTHNGVVSRLIWEAMRESAASGRTFDFAGVGTSGSVLFYTAFGGEVRPRFTVQRTTPTYGAVQSSYKSARGLLLNLKALRARF